MRRPTTLLLPALLLLGGIGATLTTPATAAAQKKTEKSQPKTEKIDKKSDDRDDDRRGWRVLRPFGDGSIERGDRAVIGVSTASFAGKRDTLGVLVESVTSENSSSRSPT